MNEGAPNADGSHKEELRLKSREIRIALAAVLGTIVLGITAPIITWRASVSGQREASRDERLAADLVELRSVLDGSLAHLIAYEQSVGDYVGALNAGNRGFAYAVLPALPRCPPKDDPSKRKRVSYLDVAMKIARRIVQRRDVIATSSLARRRASAMTADVARLRIRLADGEAVRDYANALQHLARAQALPTSPPGRTNVLGGFQIPNYMEKVSDTQPCYERAEVLADQVMQHFVLDAFRELERATVAQSKFTDAARDLVGSKTTTD